MRGGSKKGSKFERDMCKQFSLWFTNGKSDDYFWRTPSSGGRATARAKKGLNAEDYAGDMMSINPAGRPLTSRCLLEFKAGYSRPTSKQKLSITALMDAPETEKKPLLVTWWQNLLKDVRKHSKERALLVFKRDRKDICIVMEPHTWHFCFHEVTDKFLTVKYGNIYMVVTPLKEFFAKFNPGQFCDLKTEPVVRLKRRRKNKLKKRRKQ